MLGNILVIQSHASSTSLNAALADHYIEGAASAGADVSRLNLIDLDFDPVYRGSDQALEADLVAAQKLIDRADHVVWLFPLYWGNQPAILRGFVDRTFLPGWAYNTKPNGMPIKHLAGRTSRTVVTMDAPNWFYSLWYGRAAHRALERATLWYCGFKVTGRNTFHGVGDSTDTTRAGWLSQMKKAGARDALVLSRNPELRLTLESK